jgi:hypothetical protein
VIGLCARELAVGVVSVYVTTAVAWLIATHHHGYKLRLTVCYHGQPASVAGIAPALLIGAAELAAAAWLVAYSSKASPDVVRAISWGIVAPFGVADLAVWVVRSVVVMVRGRSSARGHD